MAWLAALGELGGAAGAAEAGAAGAAGAEAGAAGGGGLGSMLGQLGSVGGGAEGAKGGATKFLSSMLKGGYKGFEGAAAVTGVAETPSYLPYDFGNIKAGRGYIGGRGPSASGGEAAPASTPPSAGPQAPHTPGRGFGGGGGGGPVQATYTRPSGPSPDELGGRMGQLSPGANVPALMPSPPRSRLFTEALTVVSRPA